MRESQQLKESQHDRGSLVAYEPPGISELRFLPLNIFWHGFCGLGFLAPLVSSGTSLKLGQSRVSWFFFVRAMRRGRGSLGALGCFSIIDRRF